jgi:hypothetical protein
MNARTPLAAALLFLLGTQTGCATLVTATACLASQSKNCGQAVEAAATVDYVVLDAAAAASEPAHACGYDEPCDCE